MVTSRTFKPSGSSDANFYRLFDLLCLFLAFQLSSLIYSFTFNAAYMVAVLSVAVAYMYCAEMFSAYRSWRAGKFRSMVLCAWGSLTIAFLCLFVISFMFKFTETYSRIGLGVWFLCSTLFLYAWRLTVFLYKRNRRKLGMNLRNVAIVGATESGAYLFTEIDNNDELGFKFKGFYDDRKPERLSDKLAIDSLSLIHI